VEDLINWEVMGVKMTELSAFAIVGRASSLGARARCPLRISSSCRAEGSHNHSAGHPLWITSCLAWHANRLGLWGVDGTQRGACQVFPSAQLDNLLLGFSQNFYLYEQLMIYMCYRLTLALCRVVVDGDKFSFTVSIHPVLIQLSLQISYHLDKLSS